MDKKYRSRCLVLVLLFTTALLISFQPLLVEATERGQEKAAIVNEGTPTEDTLLFNGVQVWSGRVPQEQYIPLTPIAWALGYYIQGSPTGNYHIELQTPGQLPDNPPYNTIFITMDPAAFEPFGPAIVVLDKGYLRGYEVEPFQIPPILLDGELYLHVDEVLAIFDADISIENRVISFESMQYNPYYSEAWIPQEYTFEQWQASLTLNVDERGHRLETLYEPIHNTDLLSAKISEYATLTQGEGLKKPETIEDKLDITAQFIANSNPNSVRTEIGIDELLTQVDLYFGSDNYNVDDLAEKWPLPEPQKRVEVRDIEYGFIDDINLRVSYVNPTNKALEVAYVHIAINWKSDQREVFLALDEITVIPY